MTHFVANQLARRILEQAFSELADTSTNASPDPGCPVSRIRQRRFIQETLNPYPARPTGLPAASRKPTTPNVYHNPISDTTARRQGGRTDVGLPPRRLVRVNPMFRQAAPRTRTRSEEWLAT